MQGIYPVLLFSSYDLEPENGRSYLSRLLCLPFHLPYLLLLCELWFGFSIAVPELLHQSIYVIELLETFHPSVMPCRFFVHDLPEHLVASYLSAKALRIPVPFHRSSLHLPTATSTRLFADDHLRELPVRVVEEPGRPCLPFREAERTHYIIVRQRSKYRQPLVVFCELGAIELAL